MTALNIEFQQILVEWLHLLAIKSTLFDFSIHRLKRLLTFDWFQNTY